jgi:hypothetical protein
MTDKLAQIGRIALREEGTNWVAYYAPPDTMDGAIFLGSIVMTAVMGRQNEKRKQDFMDLMRSIITDIIKEKTGKSPVWGEHTAPEHERSGNA